MVENEIMLKWFIILVKVWIEDLLKWCVIWICNCFFYLGSMVYFEIKKVMIIKNVYEYRWLSYYLFKSLKVVVVIVCVIGK